ncbi:MAG: ImmA/IrrE family metallo-endopeptidase [Oscillospiraceae bacterium]|nr:ImmA/IrrE family metallo-endopeptidase [Oscillospiraceae bacterium]
MHLTHNDIEALAAHILRDYGDSRDAPIDLEWFAGDFLDLVIRYENLSADDSILGLTTYEDVEVSVYGFDKWDKGEKRTVTVPKNTVLISRTLLRENSHRDRNPFSLGRLRFTIAHECAHQILYRSDTGTRKADYRTVSGRPYSLRELKSRGDWCEWQANALASAILMPRERIIRRLGIYGGALPGKITMCELAEEYGVSLTAMYLRLNQLGFVRRQGCEGDPYFYLTRSEEIVQSKNREATA